MNIDLIKKYRKLFNGMIDGRIKSFNIKFNGEWSICVYNPFDVDPKFNKDTSAIIINDKWSKFRMAIVDGKVIEVKHVYSGWQTESNIEVAIAVAGNSLDRIRLKYEKPIPPKRYSLAELDDLRIQYDALYPGITSPEHLFSWIGEFESNE